MELEVVSKKAFIFCLFFSTAVIGYHFISRQYIYPNYAYICNEKNYLDIFIHTNKTDSIIRPKNIKNTLTCAGRGMIFYDRTIEFIRGNISSSLLDELNKRYLIGRNLKETQKNIYYECLHGKKNYLVLQKNLEIDTLEQALYTCKPDTIVIQKKQVNSLIFKALKSPKINVEQLNEGESIKIIL